MHDLRSRFFEPLFRRVATPAPRRTRALAFVGTAKNAGKTTALNAALASIDGSPLVPGLVSVGVDGESTDAITGGRKPPICVRIGTILITAEAALDRSDARCAILDTLPVRTPLGELVVARVEREGHVLLAGIRHRTDVIAARDRLLDAGASVVLIDGAFDRMAAAAPDVSDAVVVSTGAVLGHDIDVVVARTAEIIARLQLPRAPLVWRGLVRAETEHGIILRDDSSFEPITASPTAAPHVLAAALSRPARAVVLRGLLGDRVADALLASTQTPAVIVRDATHVHCSFDRLARLARKGVEVFADRAIEVAAVTVNPVAPSGEMLDRIELIDALASAISPLPVLDVIGQEIRPDGGDAS